MRSFKRKDHLLKLKINVPSIFFLMPEVYISIQSHVNSISCIIHSFNSPFPLQTWGGFFKFVKAYTLNSAQRYQEKCLSDLRGKRIILLLTPYAFAA